MNKLVAHAPHPVLPPTLAVRDSLELSQPLDVMRLGPARYLLQRSADQENRNSVESAPAGASRARSEPISLQPFGGAGDKS